MTAAAKPGALAGIKVIDLSRVLGGPYSTQILADHGADVIKIEPPQGDETRQWGPPFMGDSAAYFEGVNRNKQGAVLDLSRENDRARLMLMLEDADVLVENFKVGTMERWGIGYEQTLQARFPRLIYCRVSGFGADGPLGGLPGYDAAIQAMTGLMSVNGLPDGEPLRLGVPVVDMVTGLNAALGILLALNERNLSQRGQFVESALFDCALSVLHPHTTNYFASGKTPGRSGNAHPNIAPYDTFHTGTSPIFLAVGNDSQFRKLCEVLGDPALGGDERFANNGLRSANRGELRARLEQLLATHDGVALADRLIRAGVPCGPVLDVPGALAQPHTQHRQMVVELGAYRGIASPIKLGRTPASYRSAPPAFGEHSAQVLPPLPDPQAPDR
ncbi:CoA transferase [Pandoraea sp.]|uniref:CaiB/BaiF CoA transferase family protein n=1 Tax=Pandoraea sp. TaxID=1883445 RepID=UPI0012045036|nr:CoA transferase [Pandoraea sp.]TAL53655.1 MAG: CoA transferase [Pandoraea sp.]TAM14802.1 MAG: CoA transferase [Pandoraea sp.]